MKLINYIKIDKDALYKLNNNKPFYLLITDFMTDNSCN